MNAKFRALTGAVLSPEHCDTVISEVLADGKPATLPALCA